MSEETGGQGRGWRIILIASLALNLVVVGAIGGWLWRHGTGPYRDRGPHSARLATLGGPLTFALDAEGRAAIAARLRKERGAHEARRAALRESFEALLTDLRMKPFDPARVTARLDAQRVQVAERFAAGHAALVAHLAAMGDAERAAYADRLEEKVRRWRHRRPHR
ncbi:MAG: periplasmic heavy metal sensor [Roseovarius sp.]|uniref:periplasmic heavy metal sensor n=1 Tax=Roseovarius sp. TaxID=1486281 RepID=UPI00405856F6